MAIPTPRVRTYRLASDCPECGRPLVLSRRRSDAGRILRCSAFRCAFVEDYAGALRAIGKEQANAGVDAIEARVVALIFRFHPDRHPAAVASVDVTAELVALLDAIREMA